MSPQEELAELEEKLAEELRADLKIATICLNSGCKGKDGGIISAVRELAYKFALAKKLLKECVSSVESCLYGLQDERDPEYDYTEAQRSIIKGIGETETLLAEIEKITNLPGDEADHFREPENETNQSHTDRG